MEKSEKKKDQAEGEVELPCRSDKALDRSTPSELWVYSPLIGLYAGQPMRVGQLPAAQAAADTRGYKFFLEEESDNASLSHSLGFYSSSTAKFTATFSKHIKGDFLDILKLDFYISIT